MARRGSTFALTLALTLVCSVPVHAAFEMARPMGLYAAGNGPALAMLDSRIEVTVRGALVEAVVVQRFRNPASHATEATYIFPLPADAAVSAMAMRIGARTIHAAIETREAAQRRYEDAVAAGVAGALLEQERPDVFTQTVSAVPAGGVVEVTLRYDAVAHYEAGTWQLVLPLVVAPRHVPGTASGAATTGSGRAPDTDRAPDASRVTPAAAPGAGGPTAVAIHFVDAAQDLASPTHALGGTASDATLVDAHSDRDAIVRWRAPAPAAGWVERDGDAGFAAVVVEAAPAAPRKPGAALRVTLAIDRSATTRGDAAIVERPVVRALCGALDAADRVRAIGSDSIGWSAPGDALRALERSWATPMPVFDMTRVLAGARPEGAPIVLISDGLVADDPAAVAAAQRLGVPVHVIGIGPAPARGALRQIAAATGGTVRFATPGDDPAVLARAVVADLASPAERLTVNWGTLGATDVEPAVLPRLGAGQAMLVLARILRVQPANARTRGELFAFEPLGRPRAVDGAVTPRGPLARRWARERLGDLVAARGDRAKVVRHALAFGLVSPYTSLVAIGSDVVVRGGVVHSIAVPVSVPSGMQWHAVRQATEVDAAIEPEAPRGSGPAPVLAPAPPATPAPVAPSAAEPAPPTTPTTPTTTAIDGKDSDGKASRPSAKKPPPPAHRPPAKAAESDRGDDIDRDDDARSTRKKDGKRAASDTEDAGGARRERRREPEPAVPAESSPKPMPPAAVLDEAKPDADAAHSAAPEEVATLPEGEQKGEQIIIEGRAPSITKANLAGGASILDLQQANSLGFHHALWRLRAALGGGLAVDRGTHGLLSLDVGLEHFAVAPFGAEAALWLVGGSDVQGRLLATATARRVVPFLDLGIGAGLHVGDGTGLAGALRLRIRTPWQWLAGYARYDAALLLTRPGQALEHAVTLGLELAY